MPQLMMDHVVDPAEILLDAVGDISGIELFNNQVLVAIYVRPEKSKAGLYLPEKNLDEDKFQGKIGLLLKAGPSAFVDENGQWFSGAIFTPKKDWLLFRPSDGWSIGINKVPCRIFDDISIKGKVPYPDYVW